MAWLKTLAETYDVYGHLAGVDKNEQAVLLPVSHSTFNAQIEVALDLDGNFRGLPEDWSDGTANPDTRRLLALTANLAVGDGPYPDLAPAYLYSGPYAPILKAATDYWYSNTRAM